MRFHATSGCSWPDGPWTTLDEEGYLAPEDLGYDEDTFRQEVVNGEHGTYSVHDGEIVIYKDGHWIALPAEPASQPADPYAGPPGSAAFVEALLRALAREDLSTWGQGAVSVDPGPMPPPDHESAGYAGPHLMIRPRGLADEPRFGQGQPLHTSVAQLRARIWGGHGPLPPPADARRKREPKGL